MELRIFERGMIYRNLSIESRSEERTKKEPTARPKDGYQEIASETYGVRYQPLTLLVGGESEKSKRIERKNPLPLMISKNSRSMFTETLVAYEEVSISRGFDPMERIRIADQAIELFLDWRQRKNE